MIKFKSNLLKIHKPKYKNNKKILKRGIYSMIIMYNMNIHNKKYYNKLKLINPLIN